MKRTALDIFNQDAPKVAAALLGLGATCESAPLAEKAIWGMSCPKPTGDGVFLEGGACWKEETYDQGGLVCWGEPSRKTNLIKVREK